MAAIADERVVSLSPADARADARYVIYWMVGQRRLASNFALDRAVDWARKLGKPLVVLEAIRCNYRWASDRLHRFVLDGMAEHARRLKDGPVLYYPYVETAVGQGRGLLAALGREAAVVVTDDCPVFFLRRMQRSAARQLDVRFEAIDSNGLLPLRAAGREFATAHAFRRFLQKELPRWLDDMPRRSPLAGRPLPQSVSLPREIRARWPPATRALLDGHPRALAKLPIDHDVAPSEIRGGTAAAVRALRVFLTRRLGRYQERNHPDDEVSSGLSPYLHFGHLSAHQVFRELTDARDWTADRLAERVTGSRTGWWGLDEGCEGFLDQIVTWRELGYQAEHVRGDDDRYGSLPDWARQTLGQHATDPRDPCYELSIFENARTHDSIWNAAQRQLVRSGVMHNYLRMLWGKKILHWSDHPRTALEIMIELNNKYALDGRNPNSYSGILWTLGKYDRPWGPERPVFGKVRYMTSDSTARKLRLRAYLARWGGGDPVE